MKKALVGLVLLSLLFVGSLHRLSSLWASSETVEASNPPTFDPTSLREQSYVRTLSRWLIETPYASLEKQVWNLDDADNPTLAVSEGAAILSKGSIAVYRIVIPETALYELSLRFRMTDDFYTVPSIRLTVDDEALFSETEALKLPVQWEVVPRTDDTRYNRFGNELLPQSEPILEWIDLPLSDASGQFTDNYQFRLEAGEHVIAVEALDLTFEISALTVAGRQVPPSYQEYLALHAALPDEAQGERLIIEGESFVIKNDLEVKPSTYKEPAMTPYSYKANLLNQLDGTSMSRGGSAVTYRLNVSKSGWYTIAFKALKNTYLGVVSGKDILIDGSVPFQEFAAHAFASNKHFENVVLADGARVYLSAGEHSLSIRSTSAAYTLTIDRLNQIMEDINQIGLKVQTITGGNPDDALDWNILKYIPDLKERLEGYASELETIYDELETYDETLSGAPELTVLNVAAKQLLRVAKNPNKIGSKLTEFSEGSGSAYQLIGSAIYAMLNQPLSVDRIYVYGEDTTLPKPTASFFARLWNGVRAFFYSFFDDRYNDQSVDDGTLRVWVSQSTLYIDIIQSMIDEEFTATTGIPVKASIMQNTSKIVLSNATGDNPDVVLSIDTWVPYAYALRGMLEDLSAYEGFDELAGEQMANNFTTLIHETGVYGMPETQSVFLLFYRKDILNYLGLSVPDTWEDVIRMLPILQSHRLNFFHPLGGDSAYKGYGFTTPFIYQLGGEVYSPNGVESTLSDPKTIEALRFMTDLFTLYNLPLQVSSFFEHFRSGDMPLGIASLDLYLQLKYAAPELAGQWGVAPMPGTIDPETGEVLRYATSYGKASILFSNSEMKSEGWDLIRWWTSSATQMRFQQIVKTSLGERYLQVPSNMVALKNSVWDESIKEEIYNQALWSRLPAVTPASYIVERELSNIWNMVVIDKSNLMVAINQSTIRIERELRRKFAEFGYYAGVGSNGRVFVVPMQSNIDQWIPGGGYRHEDE